MHCDRFFQSVCPHYHLNRFITRHLSSIRGMMLLVELRVPESTPIHHRPKQQHMGLSNAPEISATTRTCMYAKNIVSSHLVNPSGLRGNHACEFACLRECVEKI